MKYKATKTPKEIIKFLIVMGLDIDNSKALHYVIEKFQTEFINLDLENEQKLKDYCKMWFIKDLDAY